MNQDPRAAQLPPAAWGYGGYGPGGFNPANFDPNAAGYWNYGGQPPDAGRGNQGRGDKDRDRKKKKRRRSSSSSSSEQSDWRHKVWQRGWQGHVWPPMGAGPMPGGPMWPWPGHPQMGGPAPAGGWPPPPPQPGDGPQNGNQVAGWPQPDMACAAGSSGFEGRDGGDRDDHELDRRREESPDNVPIFLEPAVEEFVPVPKALLGKVIGKQAQTIIEIREKSGAFKVDARDQTGDPCQVKVAGTAEAVKKARVLIMELIESTKNKHAGSEYVEIPRAKIGMVIGLKGAQVNEIQTSTGTKIDVDFDVDPCKCHIKGPPENVQRAKKTLLTIAMQIEDDNSEYVDLPKSISGALIGAQGSRVREFQEQSGARIDVDKTGARCRVRLTGSREQVANAKQLIVAEVENALPGISRPPMLPAAAVQPMIIPAHQPTSFPATLSESIARAKAAAEAVRSGLITTAGAGSAPGGPAAPSALALMEGNDIGSVQQLQWMTGPG